LFLTTNRVKSIDEAFCSRIHVALDFEDLDVAAKTHVWTVFLRKAGVEIGEGGVTQEQLEALADRGLNGRVIKNAVKTASSLAIGEKQKLGYPHIVRILDFMNVFCK
jgi:SpoVK/Ycf46/Vps4 family AAA+-type ATPase